MAVITFALYAILTIELIKTGFVPYEAEGPNYLLVSLMAVISLGFTGIVDSILKANWKFYAVINPSGFIYHIKRTFLFLILVFCLPIAAFVFTGLSFNMSILIKYLYCLTIILFFSISFGFTTGNMFKKAILLLLAIGLIVWLSTLQFHFLIIPLFFLPVIMFKAKNEFLERYYI
jgi:hypothetical protein